MDCVCRWYFGRFVFGKNIHKDQLILVYCRSGNRSKQASEKLGYTNIIEIGGMNSWPGETVTGDK